MKTLLLIEDSVMVVDRLVPLLPGTDQLNVRIAGTFDAALAALREMPDLVSVDLHLPDGNGLDLIGLAKAMSHQPLVVVLTATPELEAICRERGADAVFDKADVHQYLALIAHTVAGS